MAANTPVLCSDIAVFREVAGELADYFDPFSTEAQDLIPTLRDVGVTVDLATHDRSDPISIATS